ncbi:hypothetical protein C8R48DRAFT_776732 [Suillus tomentosus]|nr:hypothetical protein C8R48DRAFT_776732 [Suillus tomentosus]
MSDHSRSSQRMHPYLRTSTIQRATSQASPAGSVIGSQSDLESVIYFGSEPPLQNLSEQEALNVSIKALPRAERDCLEWVRKHLVLKMFHEGWIAQSTNDEKAKLGQVAEEFLRQANDMFHCDVKATESNVKYLLEVLTSSRGRLAQCAESFVHLYKLESKDKTLTPKAQKKYREARRNQITEPRQIFQYFLHGVRAGDATATVIMFGNPSVVETHIQHYYRDSKSPLWDESILAQITTTPIPGYATSAAGVLCAIDRKVEGRMSGTGNQTAKRFNANPYFGNQREFQQKMTLASQHDLHKEPFKKLLLDIHLQGLQEMRRVQSKGTSPPPFKPLYIPQTSAEMTIPLELLERETPPPTQPKISQGTTLTYSEQPSLEVQQPSLELQQPSLELQQPSYHPQSLHQHPQLLHQQMNDLSPFAYYPQQGHSGEGSSSSSSYSYPQNAGDGAYFPHQNSMARPTMAPGTFDLSLYAASPEVVRRDAESGKYYNL